METTALSIDSKKRVRRSESLDTTRRYITDRPTPSGLASMLKAVDQGDIAALAEIAEEIEGKDPIIQGLARTRREAVTALEWSVEPRTDEEVDIETAEALQADLDAIDQWDETLEHLATAIGAGVAVSELIWNRGVLVETNDVPGHRLASDTLTSADLVVLTDDEMVNGIPVDEGKFITFTPNSRAGFPVRVTLTRATIWTWIIKHHATADWTAFSEVFGMPIRTAHYEEDAPDKVKTELKTMLENMGPDLWAMFPKGVEFEMKEAARGVQPFEALIEMCNKSLAILWLGQTLTTDVGDRGSFAAAQVHDNIRASIMLGDVKNERRLIEQQVLRPMVRLRWPGAGRATPKWTRRIIEAKNLDADRLVMEQIRLAREAGLPIDNDDLYEMLRVPIPKNPDEQDTD